MLAFSEQVVCRFWGGQQFAFFFLIAARMCILHTLPRVRGRIKVFQLIFATFICGPSWEPIRRNNLFRPVLTRGLGLAHHFVRQTVSRFTLLRGTHHLFLWTFLLLRLGNFLPNVVVSSSYHNSFPERGNLIEGRTLFDFCPLGSHLNF